MGVDVKFCPIKKDSFYKLPFYATNMAAGMDITSSVSKIIPPGAIQFINTNISMELPTDCEAQIRPRSGLACKYGITVVNSPGTIDPDYRGEIKVALINLGKEFFTIEKGMRIAQMVISKFEKINPVLVDKLSDTTRSSGGFGSTGV